MITILYERGGHKKRQKLGLIAKFTPVFTKRIMPPRRFMKKSVKRLVEKHVAKAIEEYEKNRANLDSAGSSGGNPGIWRIL
ncbi:hypothetical protein Tco_0415723 [Tanacetum coccineum]